MLVIQMSRIVKVKEKRGRDDKKGAKQTLYENIDILRFKESLSKNKHLRCRIPKEHSTTIHVQNPRVGSYISFALEIYERRRPYQAYREQILRFAAFQACLREAVRAQAHNWRYDRLRPETRPPIAGSNGPALEE